MNRQNAIKARKISNNLLRQDNWVLRKNLKHLIQTTKRNSDIQYRIDDIGELIQKCPDIESVIVKTVAELKEQFGLSAVTFCLSEEFRWMVDLASVNPGTKALLPTEFLFFMKQADMADFFDNGASPVVRGKLDHGSVDHFGMKMFRRIRSEAIIPLFYDDAFMGSLNLGSKNPIRYQEGKPTDYLKRLAQVLSLALAIFKLKSVSAVKV